MINQVFNNFERTEFSDEIFAVFGRALTVATRFDVSTKVLARLPDFRFALIGKSNLTESQYKELLLKVNKKHKNLNRAIQSLNTNEDITRKLTTAREARNELLHESAIGVMNGFDNMDKEILNEFLSRLECLVKQIIEGEILISTLISMNNNEPVTNYPQSNEYVEKYANWVMERFE